MRSRVSTVALAAAVLLVAAAWALPLSADVIDDIVAQVSETELYNTVLDLQNFQTRYTYTDNCTQAAEYLYNKLAGYGLDVEYHYYNLSGQRRNVVAEIPGTTHPEQVYVFCGHYDSISDDPYNHAPGADDNGTGSAGVVECARIMAQSGYQFDCTIRFICFSGEEQGLYGSYYYVNDHQSDDFRGVFNMDMIGYVDQAPEDLNIVRVDNNSLDFAQAIAAAIDQYVPDLPYVQQTYSGACSDHYYFADHGFDSICAIEDMWPNYPWYHTTQDTIDKVTFSFVRQCTQAGLATIAGLSGADYSYFEAAAPSDWLWPKWNWISIPLVPLDPNPDNLLGFDCSGRLWMWDVYLKAAQVYQPPFVEFDLNVGRSYLLLLQETPDPVSYLGSMPGYPFEVKLGRMGWAWVGLPGLDPIEGDAFMSSVSVKYPSDGSGTVRTAAQDRASGDPWMSWGWSFWNGELQAAETFTPYAPFGNTTCLPWIGYRCYVNVGSAMDEGNPDQVTLIWP
jgi:hypothetical protein